MAENRNVLVIDDDEGIREICADILAQAGFAVSVAETGAAGADQIRRNSFRVIVTDIVMPDKEGIEIIREAAELRPESAIIAMSGAGNSSVYLKMARALGAKTVLGKPFSEKELLAAVSFALESRPMAGERKS